MISKSVRRRQLYQTTFHSSANQKCEGLLFWKRISLIISWFQNTCERFYKTLNGNDNVLIPLNLLFFKQLGSCWGWARVGRHCEQHQEILLPARKIWFYSSPGFLTYWHSSWRYLNQHQVINTFSPQDLAQVHVPAH